MFSLLMWRPTTFSCATLTEQRHRAIHLSIISIFPHTLSFPILFPSTSIMCFQTIPVLSQPHSNNTRRRQHNPANLRTISTSSTTPLSFSVGLWNCQSAVNKADFISVFTLQSTLSILGLTETWIRPEDSATPAALSNNFSFSHTPRQVGRGGGTGLLISNNWKYSTHSPLCNYNSFESHAITVTAPIKLQIVVIYHPPGQTLATFLEELDRLLSSFMEDGTPLLVFGDFNIHLDKHYATDFHSLIASFDLKRLATTSTHKSGNQLDLIYTHNCTADNILVQPLHISDHFFITFTLHFATCVPPTPLRLRNLRSLSPSHLSSVVSSSLPSPTHFSSLDVNAATDTLCSTLTSCLDDICPLSSRPAWAALSNPGYPMFFVSIGPNSEWQRENGANQMIHRTRVGISLCFHLSLLKSTLPNPHISTTSSTALQTCVISSEHLILSSVPLHHLPPIL